FATDPANVYGNLGLRRTRGAEISIVARPTESLRIVGGVVHYDASVEGEAVELGRAGPRPLGSTPLFARLDLDYGFAAIPGLSAQLAIAHTGDIVASTAPYADLGGEQLEVPAVTTIDAGLRFRWTAWGKPVALRLLAQNLTDERPLRVQGSNTFTLNGSRRFSLQLSADL
ncbi:MAG: TonB-dependent receptor domain-containing protein, partial [Vitreimonas sp.]